MDRLMGMHHFLHRSTSGSAFLAIVACGAPSPRAAETSQPPNLTPALERASAAPTPCTSSHPFVIAVDSIGPIGLHRPLAELASLCGMRNEERYYLGGSESAPAAVYVFSGFRIRAVQMHRSDEMATSDSVAVAPAAAADLWEVEVDPAQPGRILLPRGLELPTTVGHLLRHYGRAVVALDDEESDMHFCTFPTIAFTVRVTVPEDTYWLQPVDAVSLADSTSVTAVSLWTSTEAARPGYVRQACVKLPRNR